MTYVYDPARSELLTQLRPAHREFLRGLFEQGVVLASGPTDEGEALIIMRARSAEEALEVLSSDPLYPAGVIAQRRAQGWTPVLGPWG